MTNSSEVKRFEVTVMVSPPEQGVTYGEYERRTVVDASDFDRVQMERDEARANAHAWEDTANFHKQERDEARAEVARLRGAIEAHNARCTGIDANEYPVRWPDPISYVIPLPGGEENRWTTLTG